LLLQRGDPRRAQEVLKASAGVARSQHARVQLARTLAALADAARVQGDDSLAAEADAERAAIVDWIGPEARGLVWARNPGISRRRSQKHTDPTPMQPETPLSPRERDVASLLA